MKRQAVNPYLPNWEYVPDAEPHLFEGRVYIYGSHDRFNGVSFCLNDYVCWSAPEDDVSNWRYEGVIYRRTQDPEGKRHTILHPLAAPDVCRGPDGRYYLYYFIIGSSRIRVAVSNTPAGQYQYLGMVQYPGGAAIGSKGEPLMFDPGVFIDDDGKIYLYTGFGLSSNPLLLWGKKPSKHGPMCFELQPDMLTVKNSLRYIGVKGEKEAIGTPYAKHAFLEASSMRKYNGKYYFIYSSLQSHELCWAVSNHPNKGFQYGGVLVSNGDIGLSGYTSPKNAANYTGNTHGSLLALHGKYYVFYHRQTNRKQFSRQACAEEICFENGRFYQAPLTSAGLNGKPLIGLGQYGAYIACHLQGCSGTRWYWALKGPRSSHPYFTQTGKDRQANPTQYIANFCNGASAGFRYFSPAGAQKISVQICGRASGQMLIYANGKLAATVSIKAMQGKSEHTAPFNEPGKAYSLTFVYKGKGNPGFCAFTLA